MKRQEDLEFPRLKALMIMKEKDEGKRLICNRTQEEFHVKGHVLLNTISKQFGFG